jgi:segregation and condensation protein B
LSDLSQLPPLREFKELGEAEQALLPMDGEGVSSDEGSIETLDTGMEPSVNDDLQASAPLDETLDPIPAAQ